MTHFISSLCLPSMFRIIMRWWVSLRALILLKWEQRQSWLILLLDFFVIWLDGQWFQNCILSDTDLLANHSHLLYQHHTLQAFVSQCYSTYQLPYFAGIFPCKTCELLTPHPTGHHSLGTNCYALNTTNISKLNLLTA